MLSAVLRRTTGRILRASGADLLRRPAVITTDYRLASKKYARGKQKYVDAVVVKNIKSVKRVVDVANGMTATELASALEVSVDDVVECVANLDQNNFNLAVEEKSLDSDTILKAVAAFGCKPRFGHRKAAEGRKEDRDEDLTPLPPAAAADCQKRPPIVTIMGHVDHGKTTLLDALRRSKITEGEFGGITQHIGAFSVKLERSDRTVTFLDTPGHAAFAAMRARGARGADIVVLVVAADDGVKEQTVQSIKFAQDAGVPMIVAVNKCDKPGADPMRAKRSLLEHGIVVEDLGGEVQCVEISALYSRNLPALQEAIVLQADDMNLGASQTGPVEGVVIESSVSHGIGKICTVLITRGTLEKNDILVAGTSSCRVRTMTDERGKSLTKVTPGSPVRVSGWKDELPAPGDIVLEASSMDAAGRAVAYRNRQKMAEKAERDWTAIEGRRAEEREQYLDRRKSLLDRGIRRGSTLRLVVHKQNRLEKDVEDGHPKLNIIIKSDVEGTMEAIMDILETYNCDEQCKLQLVDFGVGPPTEKDIELAKETDAIVYTFNVSPHNSIKSAAEKSSVRLEPYNVIYRLVSGLRQELSSRLPVRTELELVGEGHVLKEFMISDRGRKKQPIAGCLVHWGAFKKKGIFKFLRKGEVVYEGPIESMKCEMEVVATAGTNQEVGVALENKGIRFKTDDQIEVYEEKEIRQEIAWQPPGFTNL